MSFQDPARLLFAEAAGELCGIAPQSITHGASQTRGKLDRGEPVSGYDTPVEAEVVTCTWTEVRLGAWHLKAPDGAVAAEWEGARRMGPRRVKRPRWRASDLLAWREALAEKPAPERVRDESGRYLSRAS
jgi:hypothetical protein